MQKSIQDLPILLETGVKVMIFLLNNQGFSFGRSIHSDNFYNDVKLWNYKNLIKSFSDNASNNCSYI